MRRGAQPLSNRLLMEAPISVRGVMMRPMGRFLMEASPVTSEEKGWAARIPEISLVVVPLFPQSRTLFGAERPCRPFPWIKSSPFFCSTGIPMALKQPMVERQSALSRKPRTQVVPFARAPSMTLR